MFNNSEGQSFFAGLKNALASHLSFGSESANAAKTTGKTVECVEFVDYPVFDIDGKEYSVDLEGSKMMNDVYEYLDSFEATNADFILTQNRAYAVPSLGKYLALSISLACESAEYNDKICYVVTHLGIENAVLLDNVNSENVEPEPVEELH